MPTQKSAHRSTGGNPKKNDFNYNIDFSDEDNQGKRDFSSVSETSEDGENIKEKMNDIAKQTGVPIWNIISLRYQKSIYPMFIEK